MQINAIGALWVVQTKPVEMRFNERTLQVRRLSAGCGPSQPHIARAWERLVSMIRADRLRAGLGSNR